jgi:hypothetical protein
VSPNRYIQAKILSLADLIGGLSIADGPWVAGGSVRAWLRGEDRYDDIDLFFASEEQADRVEAALLAARGKVYTRDALFPPSSPVDEDRPAPEIRSVYYVVPKVGIVNVARTHTWASVHALIGAFDFTVCMVATDGANVVSDPRYDEDVPAKRLRAARETTRYRVGRYLEKGFKLPKDLWEALLTTEHPTPIPGLIAREGEGTAAQAGPLPDGYGTADGHPAPLTTAAALLVDGCATCGGTGDAVEVGS